MALILLYTLLIVCYWVYELKNLWYFGTIISYFYDIVAHIVACQAGPGSWFEAGFWSFKFNGSGSEVPSHPIYTRLAKDEEPAQGYLVDDAARRK
jgi:hypothetical protein